MLTDTQHAELKRRLKSALEGTTWTERHHSLEDAAKLVGVITDQKFVSPETMKCSAKRT